jgi:hypothetical protein
MTALLMIIVLGMLVIAIGVNVAALVGWLRGRWERAR